MRRGYQRDLTREQIQADDDHEYRYNVLRRDWRDYHGHYEDEYHADCRACRVVEGEE